MREDYTKMDNKKGFLLGEFTLKTVISVICIILLGMLLANLYLTFTLEKKLEQAQGSIGKVEEGINLAAKGKEQNYIVTEPKGWSLVFYSAGLETCAGQCLCMCQTAKWYTLKNQRDACTSAGACAEIVPPLEVSGNINIDGPTGVKMIPREGGAVTLRRE